MNVLEIVAPGIQSTIQESGGRPGYWHRGIARSGAADPYALRAANVCVGNPPETAGIEVPMGRFKAVFTGPGTLAVTGPSETPVSLNGRSFPAWEGVAVRSGDELAISTVRGPGFRIYLAVSGGIEVPTQYGSRSTHLRAQIGGLQGRPLHRGDRLPVGTGPCLRRRVPLVNRPRYMTDWEIELVKGPYADPDFLTTADWQRLCSQPWSVDLNSDRMGTRLVGPRFEWARSDGGAGGDHPSNLVDGPYPAGGLLMNGDVPTILGPDGPVSGGFLTIATVPRAALWKVGQVRPGTDKVRFREVGHTQAATMAAAQEAQLRPDAMEEL